MSTPTPDVEKIAEHMANSIWWNVCGHYKDRADFVKQARPFVDKALAQARAPLVAVLQDLSEFCSGRTIDDVRARARAALTSAQ